MKPISYIVGGLVAGLVGSAIWAAVAHYAHLEIGWIAWAIGLLAGIGVRAAAGSDPGSRLAGVMAAFAAIVGVGVGKFGASYLTARSWLDDNAEFVIAAIADDVIHEQLSVGEQVHIPPPPNEDDYDPDWTVESIYPASAWAEAERRWLALPEATRQEAKGSPGLVSQTYMISVLADFIVEDAEAQARRLEWPDPVLEYDTAFLTGGYPADVWAEATQRWVTLDTNERERLRRLVEQRDFESADAVAATLNLVVFLSSFSAWDFLWLFLAVGTAYQVGSGSSAGGSREPEIASDVMLAESGSGSGSGASSGATSGPSGFYFGPGGPGSEVDPLAGRTLQGGRSDHHEAA